MFIGGIKNRYLGERQRETEQSSVRASARARVKIIAASYLSKGPQWARGSRKIRLRFRPKCKLSKEFLFRKKFTFVPLRKLELCPSIHFESRPAKLVAADTVF